MKSNTFKIQKPSYSRLLILALAGLLFGCSASVKSALDASARVTSKQKNPAPPIPDAKAFYSASDLSIAAPAVMV